ncbi:peptide chain release factor family protein [Pseudomonadota bacterium]
MDFPIELPDEILIKAEKLKVLPGDIEEHFVRGSGKGGQKINKTSSCVLLRHNPTGIEVRCQKHREQANNRISAYKLLILKVEEKVLGEKSEKAKRNFKIRKQKKRRSVKAKEKMLAEKKKRAGIKETRKNVKPTASS